MVELSPFSLSHMPEIEFVDNDTLIGLDNETTAFTIQRASLVTDGVVLGAVTTGTCCFFSKLRTVGARLFSDFGSFIDPARLKLKESFPSGMRPVIFSSTHNSAVAFGRTEDGRNEAGRLKMDVKEFDGVRGFLKRDFRINEPAPWSPGVSPDVLETLSARDHMIAHVFDAASGHTVLVSVHLPSAPLVVDRAVEVRTASWAGRQATATSIPAYDMVYEATVDRIVAAVPAEYGPRGNSLALIDPTTGAVDRFVLLSSPPYAVYASGTNGMAYVNLPYEGALQQVDLRTGQLGWKMYPDSVDVSLSSIGLTPLHVTFKPDDPLTLAVSFDGDGTFHGVGLIRSGIFVGPIARGAPSTTPSNVVSFTSSTEVVGLDLRSTTGGFSRYSATAAGIQFTSSQATSLRHVGDLTTEFAFGRMFDRISIADSATNTLIATLSIDRVTPFNEITLLGAASGVGTFSGPQAGLMTFVNIALETQGDGTQAAVRKEQIELTDTRFEPQDMGRHSTIRAGAQRLAFRSAVYAEGRGMVYVFDRPAPQ